jgi:hypothetical protein
VRNVTGSSHRRKTQKKNDKARGGKFGPISLRPDPESNGAALLRNVLVFVSGKLCRSIPHPIGPFLGVVEHD